MSSWWLATRCAVLRCDGFNFEWKKRKEKKLHGERRCLMWILITRFRKLAILWKVVFFMCNSGQFGDDLMESLQAMTRSEITERLTTLAMWKMECDCSSGGSSAALSRIHNRVKTLSSNAFGVVAKVATNSRRRISENDFCRSSRKFPFMCFSVFAVSVFSFQFPQKYLFVLHKTS